ncbi:MAG: efflux RND transporter periplasmic adaptor subunit, partial [Mariniphaga sp.]|nr:efflux RND transporter periplasmic adaptor subunit [Mariniphaga sp.]
MKNKKVLPFAIGFVVIAIVLMVVGKKAGWFGTDYSISVATSVVESKTITELITANGKIQPETEVKISPDVSGEIIELYVEEGDEVVIGDPLCIIKPDMYISAVNRAEAALNSSKARLAQAEAQQIERELAFNRTKQLYELEAIPISEFESVQANYKVAQSEVRAAEFSIKSAEASVSEAKEQLTKTKIFAPISGTISALNVEKGERVVGTNMYAGTEMMVVADLEKMEVQVEVNENDIVKVAKFDTALIEVDAYLNRKFKGVVTEIANSANITGSATDQVTNFDVKVF